MESENKEHKKNSVVVQHAIWITKILNKHLSEENCSHNVKHIAAEAFDAVRSETSVVYQTRHERAQQFP